MKVLEGIINIKRIKGSDVLQIDDIPLAKAINDFNGQSIIFCLDDSLESSRSFRGMADIFYFEGSQQYHRGVKYVNDFFIDDIDMIEFLGKFEGNKVKIQILIEKASDRQMNH